MTLRSPRMPPLALTVACGLLAAACGGSSNGSEPATAPASVDVATSVETEAPPVTDSASESTTAPSTQPASVTAPAEPGSGTVGAQGDATWEGGDFVALVETRMDELATVFGQPATPASLAPTFALPDDFPYPAGTVVGTFHVFDRDLRITDAIDIGEERIVGVDGANDVASFDAFAESLAADPTTRWVRSSFQRDSFVNDLYTADPLDGGDLTDRMFLQAATEPEAGQPPLSFTFDFAATEIPVPSWQAGLPILDGGEVTFMREGRGLVEDFGRFAEDGHIELRISYPIDRYGDLEAFFESGVIAAAGFESEDTPFSNLNIRVDVSNGDWVGTVGVGDVNVNNEDIGYELIWSLTRPVG